MAYDIKQNLTPLQLQNLRRTRCAQAKVLKQRGVYMYMSVQYVAPVCDLNNKPRSQ